MNFEAGRNSAASPVRQTPGRGFSRKTASFFVTTAILAGFLMVTACSGETSEPRPPIESARSLQVDAQTVAEKKLPLVVFVSQHGCEFCHLLREKVLHPMIAAGELQDRIILREVSLDDGFSLGDFDGKNVSGREFADRYGAVVTPTLLFLDGQGREVAEKMVGINNVEYYGFYLDKSIESATTELAKIL